MLYTEGSNLYGIHLYPKAKQIYKQTDGQILQQKEGVHDLKNDIEYPAPNFLEPQYFRRNYCYILTSS